MKMRYRNTRRRLTEANTVTVAEISDGEWSECPLEWGTVEFVKIRTYRWRGLEDYPDGTVRDIDSDKFEDIDEIIGYIKKTYRVKKLYVVTLRSHSGVSYDIAEYTGNEEYIDALTWSNEMDGKGLRSFWRDTMTSWANGTDMYNVRVLSGISEHDLLVDGMPTYGDVEDDGVVYCDGLIGDVISAVNDVVGKCDYYYVDGSGHWMGLYDKRGKRI